MKTRRINSARQAVIGISPRFRDRGLHAWFSASSLSRGKQRYANATIGWVEESNTEILENSLMLAVFGSRSGGSMRNRSVRELVCADTEKWCHSCCFMSLLLTGATGFLGRNILLRALSEGKEVLTAVRNADKLLQQLRFEKKDPQEIQLLPALPDHWPRISPRCAILGGGVLFERNRSDYFCTNVDWTLAILRALPPECRTVVISSQSAGGPTPTARQLDRRKIPMRPITWYGESKLAMERAIRHEFPNRPISILRPPMILGPRDTATLPLFRMARGAIRIKPGFGQNPTASSRLKISLTAIFWLSKASRCASLAMLLPRIP